ncbi:Protein phosphatase Slingshot 1 like [Actinidia chinensis var. chinensis]|uniref:Protein phosphatase Slingshot 1 like n=1 Tax=Actinidia chinensis var. chinensis TaxID=1590841 RepID=A0A2R6QKV5_ACTCC|nr:Protein phosphatase Slingshot 1 like [Actinidia chinensis var. chinensis]
MGSECNPIKPHYDISLSKRTRKPLNPPKEAEFSEKESPRQCAKCKSLKELIKERSSLGQHFKKEKQLQIVVKQHEENLEEVKFKQLVSRYTCFLSRLIKIKRDPRLGSRKKPALQLAM